MIYATVDIRIVVACYNRPLSLKRILLSLLKAKYPTRLVQLVISIDHSDIQASLISIAEDFDWPYGPKSIRAFDKRQGLRRHILQCGDLSLDCDGVIVLEDDLIVGQNFYLYACQAVEAVGSDDTISGISLYAPAINEMAQLPFQPAPSGFDAYFLQSSQSWGQCWTASMWRTFRDWYQYAADNLLDAGDMPLRIYSWPETSWKKYHMKFTVETGRTWLYPYVSHTSNCSDVGAHNPRSTALFQVPLASGQRDYSFPALNDIGAVQYDSFYERSGLVDEENVPLLLDIYATRRTIAKGTRFVTGRAVNLIPIRGYALLYRPQDENVVEGIPGTDLWCYETDRVFELTGRIETRQKIYHSNLVWFDAFRVGYVGLKQALPDKIRRLVRQKIGGILRLFR